MPNLHNVGSGKKWKWKSSLGSKPSGVASKSPWRLTEPWELPHWLLPISSPAAPTIGLALAKESWLRSGRATPSCSHLPGWRHRADKSSVTHHKPIEFLGLCPTRSTRFSCWLMQEKTLLQSQTMRHKLWWSEEPWEGEENVSWKATGLVGSDRLSLSGSVHREFKVSSKMQFFCLFWIIT